MIERCTVWSEVVFIASYYYPTLGARESALVMICFLIRCQ